jgi:hypothetical protein
MYGMGFQGIRQGADLTSSEFSNKAESTRLSQSAGSGLGAAIGTGVGAMFGGVGAGVGGAIGGMIDDGCWVAREVYGNDNPKWLYFYLWKEFAAPNWFKWVYDKFGERFARFIKSRVKIKNIIRTWMDTKILINGETR